MEKRQNDTRKPGIVPYIVYESEQMRSEARDKRHWIGHIVSLVVIVAIVAGFLIYLNQYDFASYQQDGEGVNIVGDGNGVDFDVPARESAPQEESSDRQGPSDTQGP